MHTQNQPIDQAPRHSSKAGATERGHPKPEGQDARGTPRPRQTRASRRTTRLHSARLPATAIPLDPSPCGRGRRASSWPQNPHLLHPDSPSASACKLWAALKPDQNGKPRGSRPARVRERDWTGSSEGPTPRWKGWAVEACWSRPRRVLGLWWRPRPRTPATRTESRISALQSPLQQLPSGCCGRLASVQRCRRLCPLSGTALWLRKEARGSACFSPDA